MTLRFEVLEYCQVSIYKYSSFCATYYVRDATVENTSGLRTCSSVVQGVVVKGGGGGGSHLQAEPDTFSLDKKHLTHGHHRSLGQFEDPFYDRK